MKRQQEGSPPRVSTGTWTTLTTLPPRMRDLQATVFRIEGNFVKIAYPLELWEEGNAAQLMSGIAGNIFGMKALSNLRLIDVTLPEEYVRHFKGPHFGMDGIRDMMKIRGRPLTGAVPKPEDRVFGAGARRSRVRDLDGRV